MNKNIKVLLIVFCCFPHCQLFQVNNAGAGSFFEEKLYPQGKKFSFGIWSVKNLQEMKQVKKDGFNFIQCYGPGEGTEEEIKQWLEWAKDTELFVMFNMGGFRKQAVFNEDGRHMKSFARRFETYKNYENIAWWHIPEEQQIGDAYEGPMIKEYCKYLHENDPQNRPVYMYIAGNYTKDDLVPYVEHLDIIGAGGYTSLYEYPRPWILWRTGQDTAAIQKANISDRPKAVISFLQMFLEDQKLGLGFGKAPTFKDIYHDIYASIAAGAKGVIAYHLSYSYQVPGVYDAFKKAAGEITGSGGLGEVILSGKDFNKVKLKIIKGPVRTVEFLNGISYPSVNIFSKEWKEKLYIIAVNSTEKEVEVKFAIEGNMKKSVLLPFEKNRVIPIDKDGFEDKFAPLEVHIYLL